MKSLKKIGTILNKQQQKKINAGGIYPSFCEDIIFDFFDQCGGGCRPFECRNSLGQCVVDTGDPNRCEG